MGASYRYPSELSALTSEPHYPLGHVLMTNGAILRAAGLRMPLDQLLGRGAFGAAYEIPCGGRSVLKLTRDPTEVQASYLLRGRASKRIVPVYGVWYLRNTYAPGFRRWYVVHRGYLHPLRPRDKGLVEVLFSLYDDMSLDLVLPRSSRQHAMINKWRNYIRRDLTDGQMTYTDAEGTTFSAAQLGTGKAVKRCMQLLMQIGAAVDEMHAAGIDWEDIHSDNLMRNDEGRLVIADVGWGLMHDDFDEEFEELTLDRARSHFSPEAQGSGSSIPTS